MDQHGTKELIELLEGLKVAGVGVIKIAKGDSLEERLAAVLELASKATVLVDAAQGLDSLDEEAKELNVEEAKLVIAKLYELSDALREARDAVAG